MLDYITHFDSEQVQSPARSRKGEDRNHKKDCVLEVRHWKDNLTCFIHFSFYLFITMYKQFAYHLCHCKHWVTYFDTLDCNLVTKIWIFFSFPRNCSYSHLLYTILNHHFSFLILLDLCLLCTLLWMSLPLNIWNLFLLWPFWFRILCWLIFLCLHIQW